MWELTEAFTETFQETTLSRHRPTLLVAQYLLRIVTRKKKKKHTWMLGKSHLSIWSRGEVKDKALSLSLSFNLSWTLEAANAALELMTFDVVTVSVLRWLYSLYPWRNILRQSLCLHSDCYAKVLMVSGNHRDDIVAERNTQAELFLLHRTDQESSSTGSSRTSKRTAVSVQYFFLSPFINVYFNQLVIYISATVELL